MTRSAAWAGLAVGGLLAIAAARLSLAAGVVTITQIHRAFSAAAVTLHRGESIHFTNDDVFDHQVFVKTPSFAFESQEQAPGASVDVLFTQAGVFDVQCAIHPRMHLSVTVE